MHREVARFSGNALLEACRGVEDRSSIRL